MKNQANLVVPGAIWARTDAKSKGRRSTILLVANQHLSGRLAQEFPPMVTYRDDKGNVNTVTEERFTSNRAFYDMDDVVMYNVQRLLSTEVDTGDEDEDEDGLALVDDGGLSPEALRAPTKKIIETVRRPNAPEAVSFDDDDEDSGMDKILTAQVEAGAEETEVTRQDVEQLPHPQLDAVFISNNAAYPELAPEVLEQSVVQYEQEPVLTEEGLGLRHKVLVLLPQGLDIDALNTAFDPEVENYYSSFKINNVVVNWNSYLGAWPVIATDGVYASLVFTTDPEKTVEVIGDAVDVPQIEINDTPEQVIEKLNQAGVTTPAQEDPATALQNSPAVVNNVVDLANAARVEAGMDPVITQPQTNTPAPASNPQVVQVPPPVALNVVTNGQMAYAQPATTGAPALDILGDTALTSTPNVVTQG